MTIGSLRFSLPDLLQPPQIFLLDPASERTVQSDVSGVAVREQSWFDSGAAVFTDARSRALCSVRQTSRWSRAAGNLRAAASLQEQANQTVPSSYLDEFCFFL